MLYSKKFSSVFAEIKSLWILARNHILHEIKHYIRSENATHPLFPTLYFSTLPKVFLIHSPFKNNLNRYLKKIFFHFYPNFWDISQKSGLLTGKTWKIMLFKATNMVHASVVIGNVSKSEANHKMMTSMNMLLTKPAIFESSEGNK